MKGVCTSRQACRICLLVCCYTRGLICSSKKIKETYKKHKEKYKKSMRNTKNKSKEKY